MERPFNEFVVAVWKALGRADPLLGGAAPLVAAALIVATVLLVPPEDRARAKVPAWLLLFFFIFAGVLVFVPLKHDAEDEIQVLAFAFLLGSMARSSFLLFAYSFWMHKVARPLPKILRDVIQGFIYLVAFLLVLRSAGVEPGSLLTTSALLTAVIGLSLQDTLGNLFAGLAIQAQRPFTVGDWVQLDSQGGQIGRVIEINWRATKVLTLDQVEVIVPNGLVAKNSITNFSAPSRLVRREVETYAPTDASPELVRKTLLAAVEHVPDVLKFPPPQVFARGFTERGLSYMVRYFIERFDRRELIDSTVRERIWYSMQRAGLPIPVPRRQVEIAPRPRPSQGLGTDEAALRLLAQVALFQTLPRESQERLAAGSSRKRFTREELIVRKGDSSKEVYVIESGRVRIELPSESGPGRVAGALGAGDFFGEMSLMTGEERAADVVASEETSVLVIDRAALAPLLEEHPELVEHLSRVLAERQARLAELQSEESSDRVSRHDEHELMAKIRRFFTSSS